MPEPTTKKAPVGVAAKLNELFSDEQAQAAKNKAHNIASQLKSLYQKLKSVKAQTETGLKAARGDDALAAELAKEGIDHEELLKLLAAID